MGAGEGSGGGGLASTVSPVFLRVALGVTFVWAGLGKLVPTVSVDPLNAAILANVGALTPAGATRPPPAAQVPGQSPGDGAGLAPEGTPAPLPDAVVPPKRTLPEPKLDAPAEPADPAQTPEGKTPEVKPGPGPGRPSKPGPRPARGGGGREGLASMPERAGTPTYEQPADSDGASALDQGQVLFAAATVRQGAAPAVEKGGQRRVVRPEAARYPLHLPQGKYGPGDFPSGAQVRRLHELTLLLVRASHPAPGPDGRALMGLWPKSMGLDPMVRVVPLVAAVTELLAGFCVLAGLFTRTGASVLASVMLGALWLTQVGPAAQSGATVLGFIPARTWWDPKEYAVLLWQLSLLCGALALAFAGPGALSLDRALGARGAKSKAGAEDE